MIDRQLIPLALMYANDEQPIEGRTRLQKMVFLIQKEFEESGDSIPGKYQYIPYDYGPFAKKLYDDIDELVEKQVIEEDPETIEDGKVKYFYALGPRGEEFLDNWSESERDEVQEVAERIKKEYNQMSLPTLIEKVYSNYPDFAENSVL
jgi:uncharacterized protein YwgA